MRTTQRLRWIVVCSLVAATGVASGIVTTARADAGSPDFILVQAIAGSSGASDVTLSVTGEVAQVKSGTLVVGAGFGTNLSGYTGGKVVANDVLASSGVRVATSEGSGGAFVSVSPKVGLIYDFSGTGELRAPAMSPGDKFDVVIFFPNGEIIA